MIEITQADYARASRVWREVQELSTVLKANPLTMAEKLAIKNRISRLLLLRRQLLRVA